MDDGIHDVDLQSNGATVAVVQWARPFASQAAGKMFESQPNRPKVVKTGKKNVLTDSFFCYCYIYRRHLLPEKCSRFPVLCFQAKILSPLPIPFSLLRTTCILQHIHVINIIDYINIIKYCRNRRSVQMEEEK